MGSTESRSVTVSILGKEYQISCPPGEEAALRESARYLDEQMKSIRMRGSTLGFEKIAVMAALNISHELLQLSRRASSSNGDVSGDLRQLEEKIDRALELSRQLEI